jgi:4-hydroxyphenylpyruvate dioxygenase
MTPALSQVCTLNSPFDRDVEDFAAGQCEAVEIWLTKLEHYLADHSRQDVVRLLGEHGISAPVASFQGGLLVSQGEARLAAWSLFGERLQLCREIGIGTLVVACDILGPLTQQDIERVQMSLAQSAAEAADAGIRIALEFRAEAAFGNNLQTAIALVAEVNSPHLGICFDVFHYFVGPSKPEDLHGLTKANLFHVQACDLADTPREFASDSDRILPGEGDIAFDAILARLSEIEYEGCVSVELMNPQIWQIPARQFGEIAVTALRRLLGQASMS